MIKNKNNQAIWNARIKKTSSLFQKVGSSIDIDKRFYKEESIKNFPAEGEASLCGAIVEADPKNGLATKITQFITGGQLKKDQ